MSVRLPDEVKLLGAPNFWHVATVNPDGSPHVPASGHAMSATTVDTRRPPPGESSG